MAKVKARFSITTATDPNFEKPLASDREMDVHEWRPGDPKWAAAIVEEFLDERWSGFFGPTATEANVLIDIQEPNEIAGRYRVEIQRVIETLSCEKVREPESVSALAR
jgi:hypothetical protein